MVCQKRQFTSKKWLWSLALAVVLVLCPSTTFAQEVRPVVEELVEEALGQNLTLQQQTLRLEQSRSQLAEARGGFFPTLNAQARYTRAAGGRTIDFPVGDLLNPVYETLNTLTPNSPDFTTIENQEINFLREREQDSRLRLSQPLFAPAVIFGTRAQRHLVEAESAATASTRQEVARDVQVAYFRYRTAQQQVEILRATLRRVEESLRTSERLVSADRATPDVAFRAEAEVLAVRQRLEEAQAGQRQARSALNLLLDHPLGTEIPEPRLTAAELVERRLASVLGAQAARPDGPVSAASLPALPDLQQTAGAARPELRQLSESLEATRDQRRVAQTRYLPTVAFVLEGGIQGTTYAVDDEARFGLASVVLQWNLFNGFRDQARIEQADLAAREINIQRESVQRQIDLQVQQALDDVRVAQRSLETAEARKQAAASSFRLTKRRYDVGRANLVTFTDAQAALTEADLNLTVTRFRLLTRLAELEFATGQFATGPFANDALSGR